MRKKHEKNERVGKEIGVKNRKKKRKLEEIEEKKNKTFGTEVMVSNGSQKGEDEGSSWCGILRNSTARKTT
jgi:hypothetical protein